MESAYEVKNIYIRVLNCAPLKKNQTHVLKSSPSVPHNVIIFEYRVFEEVIKVK